MKKSSVVYKKTKQGVVLAKEVVFPKDTIKQFDSDFAKYFAALSYLAQDFASYLVENNQAKGFFGDADEKEIMENWPYVEYGASSALFMFALFFANEKSLNVEEVLEVMKVKELSLVPSKSKKAKKVAKKSAKKNTKQSKITRK